MLVYYLEHPTSLIYVQMTRMAEERDSILRIRAQVDSHDEMMESTEETSQASTVPSTTECPRVVFCAQQKQMRVSHVLHQIGPLTENNLTGQEFVKVLSRFLKDFTDAELGYREVPGCVVCFHYPE